MFDFLTRVSCLFREFFLAIFCFGEPIFEDADRETNNPLFRSIAIFSRIQELAVIGDGDNERRTGFGLVNRANKKASLPAVFIDKNFLLYLEIWIFCNNGF